MTSRILGLMLLGAAVLAGCGGTDGPNQAPVVSGQPVATDEDTPVAATFTASDPDGDALTFRFSAPLHGTVSGDGPTITYTPAADYHGPDAITATVGDGALQATATIAIAVAAVNDLPVAVDDTLAGAEDTPTVVPGSTLVANDTDVEGDALTVTAVGSPEHGTVVLTAGTIRFQPDAGYTGAAGFAYTVSDGTGTAEGQVAVDVSDTNAPPVAGPDLLTGAEDTTINVQFPELLANDTDVEGAALSITAVGNPQHGTVAIPAAGVVAFTPTVDYQGPASFEYTLSDGVATAVGRVAVTVTPVPDPPVAVDDAATTPEDTVLVLAFSTLLANDRDPDGDPLTLTAVSLPSGGTVVRAGTDVRFTPSPNLNGNAGFTYTISDGARTATGRVAITVTPVPDAPTPTMDAYETAEDTPLTVTTAMLLANDSDIDGPSIFVSAVGGAVHGTVVKIGEDITFTPERDWNNGNGGCFFSYTVSDGTLTTQALVFLDVTPVNDAPVAVADTVATNEDSPTTFAAATLAANDTDVDGTFRTVTAVGNPQHGTVALVSGAITFAPAADFNGAASFEYTVTDQPGASAVGTVIVDVAPVNDAPVAVAQAVSTDENRPRVITLTATDVDSPSVTFAVGTPGTGTLGPVALAGPLSATVTYTPPANFNGTTTFTFTADDGPLTSPPAIVTVTVVNVPVCDDGLVEAPETCDDQGTADGDGCSATCTVELGWTCAGAPSACDEVCGDTRTVGGEQCDDGNPVDTDGCTSQCRSGRVCTAVALPGGDRFATDPATGNCYVAFDSEPTTFAGAHSACIASGGYLATITSAAEQARVALVQNDTQTAWIGAQDDGNDTDAVFRWVTGEPWGFTAFAPGQPDDDASTGGAGDCLRLDDSAGRWADTSCTLTTSAAGRVCEIPTVSCGDGVVEPSYGEQCDDRNTVGFDGCSATCKLETLFFSEYVEGSSNNKAIEIANPSLAPVSLVGCSLRLYSNGGSNFTSLPLTQTIAPRDVFVACHGAIASSVAGQCDVTNSTVINWNGNDAVELVCGVATVDVIGRIGENPGLEWGTGLTSTADNTLRRQCSVTTGDPSGADAFDPAIEYDGFANDTFGGLGSYGCP